MQNNDPRILFKYRHFDVEGFNLRSLDEMYFTAPMKFNDPYDTSIPQLYYSSGTSPEKMLEHFMRANPQINVPPLPRQRVVGSWKNFVRSIPPNILDAQAMDQGRADNEANETGVFSLSETESSILMWSHYGLKHTGFCIGYRTNVLYEALRKQADIILVPIEYSSECPIVNPYDPSLTLDTWFKAFTVKNSDWAYEKEWRIIFLKRAGAIIPLPENVIESVYFGMKIDKTNEEMLINKLKAREYPVNVFRARKQFNSYEIKFEKEDY